MGAKRKNPILLRPAPISGGVNVLTNYRYVQGGRTIQVVGDGKHDVTADFDAMVLEALLDPDSPDMASILDGVADGHELNDAEREQVRAFRERLVGLIERHNTKGHGSP